MAPPRRVLRLAILAIALAVSTIEIAAQVEERQLLAKEAGGIFPVTSEKKLILRGIHGELSVQVGRSGEMRYLSVAADDKKRDLPLEVWLEGTTVTLIPPEGEPAEPHDLRISVPSEMNVRIEANDSHVLASGLASSLEVVGERLKLEAFGCTAPVSAEIKVGSVVMENLLDSATLQGTDLETRIEKIVGRVDLHLTGKRATLRQLQGEVDAELNGVELQIEQSEAPVRLRARGGTAAISGLVQGGDLELAQTPLRLESCKGDLTVQSDAEVRFHDMQASLHFNLFGAPVVGSSNDGLLEVKTNGADVTLDQISGPVRVQGDRLQVRMAEISGELYVDASVSDVTIERPSASVTIDIDRGDVTISQAAGGVGVRSRGGDVRLLELSGAAQVEADGREVEVSWLSLPTGTDSVIRNDGGNVVVRFLGGSQCRVTADAPNGRIDTDLPRVMVQQGGSSAVGFVGAGRQPNVTVKSGGNIELLGSAANGETER